ncbi:MAG TPA: XdhC family protein [Burkholderiaceae bacterium]
MSLELHAIAARWAADNVPAVVIQVVKTAGSVPRETGTRMLVSAAQAVGTIGGGHLELMAIESARTLLARVPGFEPVERHYPLGPALGQCCGGAVTLRFARLDARAAHAWPAPAPRFDLQLYGAGHVGRAIVRLLAAIPCRVQWIDERITEAILRRGDFRHLGLIGSKTKRARFQHRFEERGIAAEVLERLTCPIGVPGIEGKEPEVIAVAVVAQLLQLPALASVAAGAAASGHASLAQEPRYVL